MTINEKIKTVDNKIEQGKAHRQRAKILAFVIRICR